MAITSASTSTSMSLSGLVEGSYRAFLVDDAGNLSAASLGSVVVDDTAPGVPVSVGVALLSDLGSSSSDGVTSDVTPSVRVVAAEAGGTVTVTASKSGESDVVCTMSGSTSGGSCDLGVLADGVWVLTASQTDVAGNVSSSVSGSVTVDTVAPVVSGVSSSTADGAKKAGVVVSVRVAFDGVVVVDTTSGSPTVTLETGATDRDATFVSGSSSSVLVFNYTVQAGDTSADLDYVGANSLVLNGGVITDVAGNGAVLTLASPGAAGSLGANAAIEIDTTAPGVPAARVAVSSDSGSSSSDGITSDATPSILVRADEVGGTVTVTASKSGASDVVCTMSGSTSGATCDLGTLVEGSWSVSVTQTDAAGNVSTATSVTVVVDTTAPTPSMAAQTVRSSAGATVRSSEIGVAYLVKSSATVATLADITGLADAEWNQVSVTAASSDTVLSATGLADGDYVLYVIDRAGNLSGASSAAVTVDDTTPA
ncbi:MAG: hypothetical protein EBX99_09155, partial [Acidimicrobiia bacterium]|nr:hypothetical protein [Acidimicrobiia bacterium]